jgi:hypothetical protein
MKSWLSEGKPWQAFKNFAILFSFIFNFVLLLVLLIAAPLILPVVNAVAEPLVGGLSDSFVDMSSATISQTIPLNTEMPIAFTLPLSTTTNVIITEKVPLREIPAEFVITGGGDGFISGVVFLSLPEGLSLPVALDLDVMVEETIPVVMNVPVEIPLNETDLGAPFNTLKALFIPLDRLIQNLPGNNAELFSRIMQPQPEEPPPAAAETQP